MENIFITEIKEPSLVSFSGMEGLSVTERFGTFFSQVSLGIDKRFASLKSSIHPVDFGPAIKKSKTLNFFKVENNLIATAELWDHKKLSWALYVEQVCNGASLLGNLKDEADNMYSWLKNVAATGKVSREFKYKFSLMNDLVESTEQFVSDLGGYRRTSAALREMYPSFEEMAKIGSKYNLMVKLIKGRDAEILVKQLAQINKMGELIIEKIKIEDIVLSEADINELASSIEYFNRAVNCGGAAIGLLNELREVFASQVTNIKGW